MSSKTLEPRSSKAIFYLGLLALALALAACGGAKGSETGQALTRPQAQPGVLPWVGRVAVDWWRGERPRERVLIGPGGVELGPAEGPLTRYLFNDGARAEDVRSFVHGFAPFILTGQGESLAFRGGGAVAASAAEQRMIAYWVHRVVAEAVGGRGGAAYGMVLSWHRSGDAGGECEEVVIDLTGEVRAGACDGVGQIRGRLADEQLRRLYGWFDGWAPFQSGVEGDQPGAAPVRVIFAGQGKAATSPGEQAAVADFASSLYRELAARRPASLPPPAAPPRPGTPPAKGTPRPAPPVPPVPPSEPAGPRLLRPAPSSASPLAPSVAAPAEPPPVPPSLPD
jgi:hypothetical protein